MRVLLDTQIALWAVQDAPSLGIRAAELIADPRNEVWVSVTSIWEIAIKHPLQRGSPNDMPIPGREAWSLFEEAGYGVLPVTAAHAAAVDDLPAVPGHHDPFDRMLVAQALTEPMRLLTRDARLAGYGELVVQA